MLRFLKKCAALTLSVGCMMAGMFMMPVVAAEENDDGWATPAVGMQPIDFDITGPGRVSIETEDGETYAVSQTSQEEILFDPGEKLKFTVEAIGDIKDVKFDGKGISVRSGEPTVSFTETMPSKEATLAVEFAQAKGFDKNGKGLEDLDLTLRTDLTKKQQQILKDYSEGNYDHKEDRMELAKEKGLEKWVDEDGYLKDGFFKEYPMQVTMFDGLAILDRPETPIEEVEEPEDNIFMGEGVMTMADGEWAPPNAMQIVDMATFSSLGVPGADITNGLWRLSWDPGILAVCGDGLGASPQLGMYCWGITRNTNNMNLIKMIYYGPYGPADILTPMYRAQGYPELTARERAAVTVSELVSNAYSGTCISKVWKGGKLWNEWVGDLWNQILAKPEPANFVAYIGKTGYQPGQQATGASWAGGTRPTQPLVFGHHWTSNGKLKIRKSSGNATVSNGNNNYNLAGAEYTVYDANGGNRGVLRIGADGWSNEIELPVGDYTFKETKAAPGYSLNVTTYRVHVNGGATATLDVDDTPQTNTIGLAIQKLDANGKNTPQGEATLAGAEFTMKFYGKTQGATGNPTRTWVLKSDAKGEVRLDDAHKVSGDAFYKDRNGNTCLPLGTVTIQETKAPGGYYLNSQVITQKITAQGTGDFVNIYQTAQIRDQVNQLVLTKSHANTGAGLSGAVFEHTYPNGTKRSVTSDSSGRIWFTGLGVGTHLIKETKAPSGYQVQTGTLKVVVTQSGMTITKEGNLNVSWSNGNTTGTAYQANVKNLSVCAQVRIVKKNENGTVLQGARFGLFSDAACTKKVDELTSDSSGVIVFPQLDDRKAYYVKELEAPEGYRIPVDDKGNVPVTKIYTETSGSPATFRAWVNDKEIGGSGQDHTSGGPGTFAVNLGIVNYTQDRLPETGNDWILPSVVLMGVLVGLGIWLFRKKD